MSTMPDAPQTTATAATTPPDSVADAHLAQLHKMSTTAGVTNLDYVAVNHTAIVAALLGIASALAFFGWLLLLIPVVGIVFAIIAIRQIKDSSGTQTGKGLAITGLVLCLLLGGGVIIKEGAAIAAKQGDEHKIADTISQVGQFVHDGKYPEAYALFTDEFHQNVTPQQFASTWKMVQSGPPVGLGKIQALEWNGVSPVFETEAGAPIAITKAKLKSERAQDERFDIVLRRVGNRWLVTRFQFFPEKKRTKPADDYNI